jgi:hypothetical protein
MTLVGKDPDNKLDKILGKPCPTPPKGGGKGK